jgi:CobQ/CobB/MinD/ParA nucleotide binding domain
VSVQRKRLVMTVSQKGGVGKTTLMRGLVEIARRRGLRTAAYDADGGVGQLLKHYGTKVDGEVAQDQNPLEGVGYFNVRDLHDKEAVSRIDGAGAELVVLDLPGGTLDVLADVVPGGLRGLAQMYREEGWGVQVLLVITPLQNCALEVLRLIEHLGGAQDLIVVKNPGHFPPQAFYQYAGDAEHPEYGRARAQLLAAGGRDMTMPPIRWQTYLYLDEHSLSFGEALQSADARYRGDRTWIRTLLRALEAELAALGVV